MCARTANVSEEHSAIDPAREENDRCWIVERTSVPSTGQEVRVVVKPSDETHALAVVRMDGVRIRTRANVDQSQVTVIVSERDQRCIARRGHGR